MKLMTKELEKELAKHPLYSHDGDKEKKIIVKYFTPDSNWTWYVTEGSKREDGDWEFFGLVEGFETEWGYFVLSELESVKGPLGLLIERDLYFDNMKIVDTKVTSAKAA